MKNPNSKLITQLREFSETIKDRYNLICVFLFGSQARGDASLHSDIDLIVVGEFREKFIHRGMEFYEALNLEYPIDVFCYTPEEFQDLFFRGVISALDAIDEGICLFGNDFFQKYRKKLAKLKKLGLKKDPPVWILPNNMEKMTFE
jgi:predicted nucleotidyltransferase